MRKVSFSKYKVFGGFLIEKNMFIRKSKKDHTIENVFSITGNFHT